MDPRETVAHLSDEDLAQQLKSLKQDVGPITPTTRPLYEKRLLKYLLLEQASTCTIPYNQQSDTGSCNVENAVSCTSNGTDSSKELELLECSTYYGVLLPPEVLRPNEYCVFAKKEDAIKLMKEKKVGRFKAFGSRSEAEEFSRNSTGLIIGSPKNNTNAMEQPQVRRPVPNESSSFKSLKFQELIPLRKAIESEDMEAIRLMVWSNPRYLIGSGDNPTILHEGSRYNALHICASRNKPESCKLILETIQNPLFAQMLYPDDSDETRNSRIDFFTDLYLNTPDKHLGETPLHFACKYGNVEMVQILVNHPCTDKRLKNIDGAMPKDVICARIKNAPSALINNIISLFENQYYVQVFGTADNSIPAKVAPPWSPRVGQHVNGCASHPNCVITQKNHSTPVSVPVTLKACAGPMSAVQAEHFHNMWTASPGSISKELRKHHAQIRRGDSTKGLERIGREISRKMDVPWSEFWEFLDCHVDLSSADGLRKFEDYLQRQKDQHDAKLLEQRELERQKRQDISICQLFHQWHLSDGIVLDNDNIPPNSCDSDDKIKTWPPSYAKCIDINKHTINDEVVNNNDFRVAGEHAVGELDVESESNASDASYHTAVDDADLEYSDASEWFDEDEDILFIYGDQPCRTDVDALRSLEMCDVSQSDYPLVYRWQKAVLSYKEDVRNRWVPFERLKHGPSPIHPLLCSTPTQNSSFNDEDNSSTSEPDLSSDFSGPSIRVKLWQ